MKIYLDYSASTPLDSAVTTALKHFAESHFGNASSIHYAGRRVKDEIEKVRFLLAEKINCTAKEITFTSGGTEANNLALIGTAFANREKGNHILVSATEHPSVIQTAEYLAKTGFKIDWLQPDNNGVIQPDVIKDQIRESTILVSAMFVNNETGVINPVDKIAQICRDKNVLFHCDAVQAFGKIPINLNKLCADLVTFSAHKIYGPAGSGALFVHNGTPVERTTHGGGQEANRRAGTENLIGIFGFGAALMKLQESLDFFNEAMTLRNLFEESLKNTVPAIELIGQQAPRSPYISSIAFPGIKNDTMLMSLDMAGIAASAGSACSSGSISRSHVLQAMQLDEATLDSAIRFSFGKYTTEEEIHSAVKIISDICSRFY